MTVMVFLYLCLTEKPITQLLQSFLWLIAIYYFGKTARRFREKKQKPSSKEIKKRKSRKDIKRKRSIKK
jgi:hypothetical protein